MPIELPNLPYAHDALEPFISATTLKTHHGKHHRGYVDKLNGLLRERSSPTARWRRSCSATPAAALTNKNAAAIFNNAAQAWNHAFYWKSLRPPSDRAPEGALARAHRVDVRRPARLRPGAHVGGDEPLRQRLGVAGCRPRMRCRS